MKNLRRLGIAIALAGMGWTAFAQTGGETEKRGSIPIGTSQDGSGPADGAIIGGSIGHNLDSIHNTPQRAVSRCKELRGALREECIRDLASDVASTLPPTNAGPIPAVNEIYADPRRRRR